MIVIRDGKLRKCLGYIAFIMIPLLIAAGIFLFGQAQYAIVILLVSVAAMALFITGFERRRTGSRRLILVSIMVALSVAGRFIPIIKPVAAMTILAGIYLGREAGFLTGALSAVISNFYFGQGPWTPFQMFAWGMIGFGAGCMAVPLKWHKGFLWFYGALSGAAYSLVMDVWTVLWYSGGLDMGLYMSALVTALPFMALYAVSNVIFLLMFAKPFGQKLERLRKKYDV